MNRQLAATVRFQIGLALASYVDAQGTFPPGYITGVTPGGVETGPGWGWCALLLPQLELSGISGAIDYTRAIETQSKATTYGSGSGVNS